MTRRSVNGRRPLIGNPRCSVCGTERSMRMCAACGKSYERYAFRDAAVLAAIVWAARRARRYAVARERLRQRLKTAGLLRGKP